MTDLEERVERLEMELAHQQRLTDQLNATVAQQSLDILRMQRRIQQLVQQVEAFKANADDTELGGDTEPEKPPHY